MSQDIPRRLQQPMFPNSSPEATRGLEALDRHNAAQAAHARRGVASFDIFRSTGSDESHNQFNRSFARVGDYANEIRSKDVMQGLVRRTFNVQDVGDERTSLIDTLPHIDQGQLHEKEPDRMRQMFGKLRTSLRVIDARDAKSVEKTITRKNSYVVPYLDTFILYEGGIREDIAWLEERMSQGPGGARVHEERENIFRGYRDTLVRIKNSLTTPAAEHEFGKIYGADKRSLEDYCRDPEKWKGAGQMAGLIVIGTLLAFLAVHDFKKGSLSFSTMLLAGAAMFLSRSGPKTAVLSSSQFARLSGRIGKGGIEKLQNFARTNSGPYNHLVKTLKDRANRGGITEENLHLLTDPKNKRNKVPEDIARMFIGDPTPAGSAYVLARLKKLKDPKTRRLTVDLAGANANPNAHRELNDLIRQDKG
ncbi:hypothetical protein CL635_02345 [bacterium]|nr:hypothetical protein [bacterium]|tara:strand:+ start:5032 stop:6291 length:1260 start_codon:yes stop_codon:yes gene_type:complete